MAIYHLAAKTIGRNQGRSATAAAAYRAGARIVDTRTGLVFDYSRKRGVDSSEILTPDGTVLERSTLWNAVEQSEKRIDAQVAREIEVALPRELSPADMRGLVRAFVHEQFVSRGMIADVAFHHLTGSNPHAHILLTMREWDSQGFGLKRREWNDRALCVQWRERWAEHANSALRSAGHSSRIDSRTLIEQAADAAEQGRLEEAIALAREPTIHERGNPAARAHNAVIAARIALVPAEENTPAPSPPDTASAPAAPDDDEGFISAMLVRTDLEAAHWRFHHRQAFGEAAWLTAHADAEGRHVQEERWARQALNEARYAREHWLRTHQRPFWPWRWPRWRRRLERLQVGVDRAQQAARDARAATSPESLHALEAERAAHQRRWQEALQERRLIAELPSEQQARCAAQPPPEPKAEAIPPEPAPELASARLRRALRPR